MAKTKTKTKIKPLKYEYPKPKTSLFSCCFGCLPHKTPTQVTTITGSKHSLKQKTHSNSCFPWQRIRLRGKNLTTKTVPLEGSESDEEEKLKLKPKGRANKLQSSKWKSKSNLHNNTQASPVTPNQTPSQSQTSQQNSENNIVQDDTCQQGSLSTTRAATAMSHAVSLPSTKRQVSRLLSSMQSQTTLTHPKQLQNAKRYNPVVGTSVVLVTLVIMILWGRLCAILCASAWLYLVPRLRMTVEEDVDNSINNSNNLDLDSKVYKKKVILEGLLQRNHSGVP